MASITTLNETFGGRPSPGPLPTEGSGLQPHRLKSIEASLFDKGIFKDTLLPSLGLHSGLAIAAYAAGRYTNRVEAKDWLWPSAQLANAWWSAVGRRLVNGMSASAIFHTLSRPESLILTGVTLWGGRLLWRVATRSLKRGTDDERYEELKKDPDFWNTALFQLYLPEAVFQTLIALPFSAPFRHTGAALTGYHPALQSVAVGLFAAGFALEVVADWQLDEFKEKHGGKNAICRDGVWSLVRHPNYLGDTLVHLSFPLLLYASDILAPIEVLGALANYAFLRYIGGDKHTEHHQERRYSESNPEKLAQFKKYQAEKNAFWPDVSFLSNKWTWIVAGFGVAGAVAEGVFHGWS